MLEILCCGTLAECREYVARRQRNGEAEGCDYRIIQTPYVGMIFDDARYDVIDRNG